MVIILFETGDKEVKFIVRETTVFVYNVECSDVMKCNVITAINISSSFLFVPLFVLRTTIHCGRTALDN